MHLQDQKIIDKFEQDGFVIIPGALDETMVNRIVEAGDRMIASDIQTMRVNQGDDTDGFRNSIAQDHIFIELLACPKILPYLVTLLGADIKLLTSQLIYRYKSENQTTEYSSNNGWHRDFIQAQRSLGDALIPRLDIKAAYCLSDLPIKNCGGTLFSKGSHLLKEALKIEHKKNPLNFVEPILKKGDCVLFENRTWHAGGVNYSDTIRKVIMMGYTYTWVNAYDYDTQSQKTIDKAFDLYGNIGLQLLGALPKPERFDYNYQDKPLTDWAKDNNIKTLQEVRK